MEDIQREVEYLIASTPTSERRNKLTDVNIHVMSAIKDLKELPNASVNSQI
jgi:hypothetical protein